MRIEICGGIAAGKTTFATLMQNHGLYAILENFQTNPFWKPFYTNPGKYIFETEITFLLQHYHDIKISLEKKTDFICDFSLFIDLAYAQIGLEKKRLRIFKDALHELIHEVGVPFAIVHLRCDPEIQHERIMRRGRSVENSVTVDFLRLLDEKIDENLLSLSDDIKIISVDSGKYDFVNDDEFKEKIVKEIKSLV